MSTAHDGAAGFAGLSHLGIVYSLATAARGFDVIGYDPQPGLADALNQGRFPVHEPGLAGLFERCRTRVRYGTAPAGLASCPVIFIARDVPTDERNQSDLEPLNRLIAEVSSLNPAALVILSQAPPGFCRRTALELERQGRRTALFYQVETLVFGNAVQRATEPERIIVGCADPGQALPAPLDAILNAFGCPVFPVRYESAELCKIAINCFLVSSVSTANMLAEISEKIGADWSEIVPTLRLDRRIGPYAYLSPGLGFAGGNLERDLVTVQSLAATHGADTAQVAAWQHNSHYRKDWALRTLHRAGLLAQPNAPLAIWGVAYKPDTHSTKNSPSVALLRALHGYPLRTYDPAVSPSPEEFPTVEACGSALEAARNAGALAVMTPWKEFSVVPLDQVRREMRGSAVLDPYGILDGARCRNLGFDYYRLGV